MSQSNPTLESKPIPESKPILESKPAPQSPSEYEFSAEQNGAIGDLASKMRFVGRMSIFFGAVLALGGIAGLVIGGRAGGPGAAANLIAGTTAAVVGVWTLSAAAAFQNIVDTEGHDIKNLMDAVEVLRRIFSLQRALYILGMVLLVLAVQLYFLFIARGR